MGTKIMKQIFYCTIILLIFSTGCGRKSNDWFLVEKLDNRTYIISEPNSSQGNSCFLIMGDKEAILFDSGTGENKLKSITQVTDSLTKLPLTLLMSHFHFDHIGNVNDFNRIGIPEIQLLKKRLSVDSLLDLNRDEVLTKDKVTLKISKLFAVGKEIDLGNRKIKILYTPGHSKESISIIDNENGYIFTGDLVYNGLLLLNDCNAYIHSINDILKNSDSRYRVFGSHGKPEVNYERLTQIKKAMDCYLADSCSYEPVRQIIFFGSTKDVYKIENISFIHGSTDAFNND
jgi:glyoxylase-like metal-dependent hydrolase (beta-lactamase superfamily II)